MSWIGDTLAGMKRIVQLDSDVARLRASLEKTEAAVLDHEKRLIRIETMIELARSPSRLPPR
ncbi:MAG: hypothetical protein JO013_11790 [Alphaproteobacteria bacterium]|nr:hypothetical protein [Alphaproteobacteria bacterium]